MNISNDPLFLIAAILPVAFLLIMILVFGWGVAKAAPFGILIAGIAAVFLFRSSPVALVYEAGKGIWSAATIPPVNEVLSKWKIGFAFPRTVTGYGFETAAESLFSPMKPLTYAGTFLALSSLISFLYYKKMGFIRTPELKTVWAKTVKKCVPSTIAILTLIVMSRFMSSSGMIYVLSQTAANSLGWMYILASPFFGMLGAFITSSNMSSNILMGSFQRTAADLLGINPAVTVTLQTMGGILGNAFAPGCVIMGLTTTGYAGKNSDILQKIMPVSFTFAVIFGAAAMVLC